ncbi:cupredoxin domain-containing protein [Paenibacillus spongiae]|uniref:Cupredoxin domain-containing protein n=1 Tax=Paenibacillus spongiae TaxID=2909671 RepID=A0ABY5SMK4_9BACL|nr:cupredoxin domain-containing protein [Paenibacillus spongiae]UVI33448.1 cupredoxin domain-containing protein [Paenibacillus spongiae]
MSAILLSGLFGVLAVWITGFIITFRKQLTCMVGMMAAMALGMTVGLALGALLTLWLPGQFFYSTVISMIAGGAIGVLAGAPISLMAVMDGLLSGIMGGMMGTMLMVMMPQPYAGITVKFMSVICSGILFLLYLMLQGEIKTSSLRQKSFLLSKPVSMFAVIAITLIFTSFSQVNGRIDSGHKMVPASDHSKHTNTRSSSEAVDKELLVQAMEFSFSPTSIRVVEGQKVKISLANQGKEVHDFEIVGTSVHIHSAPGEKNSMIVSFDKAGYYQVVCTLPGHKEAGMTATIHVAAS